MRREETVGGEIPRLEKKVRGGLQELKKGMNEYLVQPGENTPSAALCKIYFVKRSNKNSTNEEPNKTKDEG